MPNQPIAVELEAINRDGETQVVRDSGLALATWVADYDTIGPAYELAERLSLALAIPLDVLVPEPLIPVQSGPAATTS